MNLQGETMKIDLHIHSDLSDGDLNPIAAIDKAYREGCKIISITDHETILGYNTYKAYAEMLGIQLLMFMRGKWIMVQQVLLL